MVPVVDIAPWRSGDEAAKDRVARAVDSACRSSGFLHLTGHTISPTTSAELLRAMSGFFAQPTETKLELRSPAPEINRGYAPSGAERLAYSLGGPVADDGATDAGGAADLFEAFNVGPHDPDLTNPAVAAEIDGVFAPNLWPSGEAGASFRHAVTAYFIAVRRQAHELTAIYARALGLAADHFETFTDHSTDMLRLVHYPAPHAHSSDGDGEDDGDANAAGAMGMGAHTDYGITTLLLADAVPGLEVLLPDTGWTPVLPRPGHLLINLGDLLAQWTNDHWRSTLHRVQPPAPGRPRRSAAFFHDGNHDAMIECLPTCTSPDDPPRYAPVVAGDHVRAKLLGPRTLQASTATSTVGDRQL